METTYIVSGFMRTGTSMMMAALEAGGLDPVFNPSRDDLNDRHGDEHYKPNEGGFYELSRQQYQQIGFPGMYAGRLLKCLWGGLPRLCPGQYLVVFMMRDPEEIRQSFEAFFGTTAPPSLKQYKSIMDLSVALLRNRRDTHVHVLQYRDAVDQPLRSFRRLRELGWPISVDEAAAIVDPDLCRFRLEGLEVGI